MESFDADSKTLLIQSRFVINLFVGNVFNTPGLVQTNLWLHLAAVWVVDYHNHTIFRHPLETNQSVEE